MTQERPAVTDSDSTDDEVRDVEAITKDIEQTRAELVATVDRIVDRVSPKRVVARWKDAVSRQVDAAKNGQLTPVTATAAAAAVSLVAIVAVVLRRRRSR
jgi:DNA phosphorothioation-dependent restriction protein DptG